MAELRKQRWRVTILAEFETTDYPVSESDTAEIQAAHLKRATERGEADVNCSRADVRLVAVDRVAALDDGAEAGSGT